MTALPIHPYTGLQAIGTYRDGRPIWPVLGGSQPLGEPAPPANPADPTPGLPASPPGDPAKPPPDQPLGEAGMKALEKEREARKALEKQLAELAPLRKLAGALTGDGDKPTGKSEVELLTERLTSHETELAVERQARWRAEVAAEKGLTPPQAARLVGQTREELLADADALAALFPAGPAVGGRTPAPDPSQGARGGVGGADLDAQIKDAQGKGDWRTVITLQNQKLANIKN